MTTTDAIGPQHRLVSRGIILMTAFDPVTDVLPPNVAWYRASGGHKFVFVPVRLPGGHFRAYIRRQPGYGTRSTAATAVHRLQDRHGHYICWTPEPTSAEALLKLMRIWSECTVTYIMTGQFGPRRG